VKLSQSVDPSQFASKHGFEYRGIVGNLDGIHLLEKKKETIMRKTHPHFDESIETLWFENQIAKRRYKRAIVSDPLYKDQWHLHMVVGLERGININVEPAWQQNVTGNIFYFFELIPYSFQEME
jgi:hypothetical protein